MTDYIPQNYINQAIVLLVVVVFCVGVVTMFFSACRVVRKISTFSKGK